MDNLIDDLRHKYLDTDRILAEIEKMNLSDSHPKFKKGDVIDFWGGYNNDIRYRSYITGFDGDDIFIFWDCYWYPIKDESKRDIQLVTEPTVFVYNGLVCELV